MYVSDFTGISDVFVAPSDGEGAQCAITSGGCFGPAWSPDGREIHCGQGDSLWVTRFVGPGCRTEGVRRVDGSKVRAELKQRNWDVLPNGNG